MASGLICLFKMGQDLDTATQPLFITQLFIFLVEKWTELIAQIKFTLFQYKIINGYLFKPSHKIKIKTTPSLKFQSQLTLIKQ